MKINREILVDMLQSNTAADALLAAVYSSKGYEPNRKLDKAIKQFLVDKKPGELQRIRTLGEKGFNRLLEGFGLELRIVRKKRSPKLCEGK